jgi:hypothetical protein
MLDYMDGRTRTMTTERLNATHTPVREGTTKYSGMQGDCRVFHVMAGPNLPPPYPHARLIEAAPALLVALEAFVNAWETFKDGNAVIEDARAAIRAARGEG